MTTIEDFTTATIAAVKTEQPRHYRAGAEAMVQLLRQGSFTAEFLNAYAAGIRAGICRGETT